MKDLRIQKLAKNLVGYSVSVKKGENVLIIASSEARDLVVEIVKEVYRVGGFPFVRMGDEVVGRAVMMGMTEELSKKMLKYTLPLYDECQCYIGIRASRNEFEDADVPHEKKISHAKHYGKPIHDVTDKNKQKWCILNWPNESQAQMAQTSVEAFEDFFFDVCTMDYSKMAKAMQPLKALMEKTDKVRLVAPDTDLTFSIKGQYATPCAGTHNIPDGEIMTSPLRESVNGRVHFNTPSMRNGIIHNDVTLDFKDGKVIKAVSSNTEALNKELDSDEGARYTGEFAFGVNPYIKNPMNDTLFDEKIGGSIHIALGKGYPENYGKGLKANESQIHWDIILRGCDVYFDGVLIRKAGKFVLKELQPLDKLI